MTEVAASQPAAAAPPQQRRAKVACKRCNAKRVKCDAYASQPCSNCHAANHHCELIESRRGRHIRTGTKKAASRAQRESTSSAQSAGHLIRANSRNGDQNGHRPVFHSPSQASIPLAMRRCSHQGSPGHEGTFTSPQQSNVTTEGSEMLFVRLAEPQTPARQPRIMDARRSIFLGEPFNLTYVVHEVLGPLLRRPARSAKTLHFPIPDGVSEKPLYLPYDDITESEELERLQKKGCLTLPPKPLLDQLLAAYFEWFHPAFPVVDREELIRDYEAGNPSYQVFHAILMIAVSICDAEVIENTPYSNRHVARLRFYDRARALYDADYETDKTHVVRAAFLMSFWWGGPRDTKDSWYWLGVSVTLAQTSGMHRTAEGSNMASRDRKLWRRIWWSIYIRDHQVAMSLGKPIHIRDYDCDVEVVTPDDLMEGEPSNSIPSPYLIHMMRLSMILDGILITRYSPRPVPGQTMTIESLHEVLMTFRMELPEEFVYRGFPIEGNSKQAFWAMMLNFYYNNLLIQLHRPYQIGEDMHENMIWQNYAFTAANDIARMVEDLLARREMQYTQVHLITALFAALSQHLFVMRTGLKIDRHLADNRARFCMLGLSEMGKSWPVSGWVFQLFQSIIEKVKSAGHARDQNINGTPIETTTIKEQPSESATPSSGFNPPPLAPSYTGHSMAKSESTPAFSGDDYTYYPIDPAMRVHLNPNFQDASQAHSFQDESFQHALFDPTDLWGFLGWDVTPNEFGVGTPNLE